MLYCQFQRRSFTTFFRTKFTNFCFAIEQNIHILVVQAKSNIHGYMLKEILKMVTVHCTDYEITLWWI